MNEKLLNYSRLRKMKNQSFLCYPKNSDDKNICVISIFCNFWNASISFMLSEGKFTGKCFHQNWSKLYVVSCSEDITYKFLSNRIDVVFSIWYVLAFTNVISNTNSAHALTLLISDWYHCFLENFFFFFSKLLIIGL